MCNSMHSEYVHIPKKGFGYKIFKANGDPCFADNVYCRTHGWIKWDDRLNRNYPFDNCGFCFFLTKKEAQRALDMWEQNYYTNDNHFNAVIDPADRVIRKIEYAQGICRQEESEMIDGIIVTMALCKAWRFALTKGGVV